MAGFTLFTVELVADSLFGPISVALDTAGPSPGRPALGFRLLDLPPSILEAPEDGKEVSEAVGNRFSFGGRGKALMIELPDAMLEACVEPIPLWLMVLVRDPERPTNVATLVASACVDLRAEVDRAAGYRRQGLCAPCPFQRCTFKMTAVRNTECVLQLECLLRIFAGSQQPPLGGEPLLEPAAVAVFAPGAILRSDDRSVGTSSLQSSAGREVIKQSCTAQTQTTVETDETSTPLLATAPTGSSGTSAPHLDRTAHIVAPNLPRKDGAVFPGEMCFGRMGAMPSDPARAEESPRPAASRALSEVSPSSSVLGPLPGDYASAAMGPPSVPPSLPLVAEMLRELRQIRSIS